MGVTQTWEKTVRALEGIGAQVEAAQPGLAYFEGDGLRSIHRDREGVIAAARRAVARPSRIGVAATRFCALAASLEARSRRARIVDDRDVRRYLAAQPISLLGYRDQTAPLVPALGRLGVSTLGDLAALGAGAVADRFGDAGTLARRLALGLRRAVADPPGRGPAGGVDARSVTRTPGKRSHARFGVLIDRLLARPERRGRTIRAVMLSARLVERGTWCEPVVFRQALVRARPRMRLALAAKLGVTAGAREDAHAHGARVRASDRRPEARCSTASATARMARLREAVAGAHDRGSSRGAARYGAWTHDRGCPSAGSSYTPLPRRERHAVHRVAERAPRRRMGRARDDEPIEVDRGSGCEEVLESGWCRTAGGPMQPVHRRYWELVTVRGRNVVVFHDLVTAGGTRRRRRRQCPARRRTSSFTATPPTRSATGLAARGADRSAPPSSATRRSR